MVMITGRNDRLALRLEIKHLRLIQAIAEFGNVTRAAAKLCISQPALSKQLLELERSIELSLFHRTKRAMLLTEAGELFLTHARKILDDVDQLEGELQRLVKGEAKTLRISVDRVHQDDWLLEALERYRAQHPSVELGIKSVPNLLEALLQRDVDLIVVGEVIDASGVNYVELCEDEMLLVTSPEHPLARRSYIELQDLNGVELAYSFALEESYLHQRYLHPNRVRLGAFHHIQKVSAILKMVETSRAVSILPRRLIEDEIERGRIAACPIGQTRFLFTWYAGMLRDHSKPHLLDFVELARATL